MGLVTLSSKYQIVIPQDIRKKIGLKPGQKIVVIEKDGVVHLIPQRSMKDMRGFAKGVDTHKLRNEEDHF